MVHDVWSNLLLAQEIEYSLHGVKTDRMSLEFGFEMRLYSDRKRIPAEIIEMKQQ